ncbi:MAG: hypothetical protein HY868_25195 [Chloroflexi bacterium]|nr:hypothetical protein [Chloroflexota bacterium]
MSGFILSLDAITADDAPRVGGKAWRLGELMRVGVRVPPGFVITTDAYRAFIASNGLQREIESLLARPRWDSPELKSEITQFQTRLRAQPIPSEIADAISSAIALFAICHPSSAIRHSPFAVRSSALAEDSAVASFAGQHDTLLNQRADQILDAVKACWASLWNERALAYRHRANLSWFDSAMGVVVQMQIPSEVSGVMFTLDPLTGREDRMTIESSWGLGEAIVSGHVTPDHFVVNWSDEIILVRDIADKSVMIVPSNAGTRDAYAETPREKRNAPSLADAQALALADLGMRVQTHYGAPQDIEWAWWQDEFYILQARPLTAIHFTAEYGQWTSANFREVMPGFVSPLSASVSLQHDYPRALAEFLHTIRMSPRDAPATEGRLIFGRAFWRFDIVKEYVARLPGFNERAFDETVGITPSYAGDGRVTPFNLATIVRGLPVLMKLDEQYKKFWKEAQQFQKQFEIEEREFIAVDLAHISDEMLTAWIQKMLDLHWRTQRIAMMITFLSTQAQDDLRVMINIVNHARPSPVEPIVMANLLAGLGNVTTARPIAEMENLAHLACADAQVAQTICESNMDELPARLQSFDAGRAWWTEFQDFIARFRFLAEVDEDFALPRYDEDATIPLRVLKQMLTPASSLPCEAGEGQGGGFSLPHFAWEEEEKRAKELHAQFARAVWRNLPKSKTRVLDLLAAFTFDEQLATVRRYAWWREETRELVARAHYLARRFFLELGKRWAVRGWIAETDDVFLLTREQILEMTADDRRLTAAKSRAQPSAVSGHLHDSIARYKRLRAAYRNFDVPWTINVPTTAPTATTAAAQTSFAGVPCGGGRVCGRARVIHDPREGNRLQRGEILIAPYTNPNWTPLFGLAAGIVMEEGGLLSHGAVIAREVGIPAVLQIKCATQVFRDGQMLCVDGTRGIVEVVE